MGNDEGGQTVHDVTMSSETMTHEYPYLFLMFFSAFCADMRTCC